MSLPENPVKNNCIKSKYGFPITAVLVSILFGVLLLPALPARADILNDIINPQESPAPQSQSAPPPPPAKATASPVHTGNKELWVKRHSPIEHLQLVSTHPLPGESCKNVIFDVHPGLHKRHEFKKGKTISFQLKSLCLLGLRNVSPKTALVVRLGEAFKSLAIFVNEDLFTGLVLAPLQQIRIPLRPLKVGRLQIPVEVVWKKDVTKENPKIDHANIIIIN